MNIDRPIKVFVCHESPLVCAGLMATLQQQAEFAVTVNASRMHALAPEADHCDVIVADYATGLRYADTASASRRHGTTTAPRLLLVTTKAGEWDIRCAMARGIQGYLLLGCREERLVEAVRSLARGGRCYDDAVSARIADSLGSPSLTKREHDVLDLMSQGAGNKHIARALDIQLGTVKAHVKAILEKLQVSTRTQAVVVADHRGLLRAASLSHGHALSPYDAPRVRAAMSSDASLAHSARATA